MKSHFLVSAFLLWSSFALGQAVIDASKTQKAINNGIEVTTYQDQPFTGMLYQNHPNGKPKSWTQMKDGLPDGLWQEWWENGHLKFNAHWSVGKGHGLWEYYHENGNLRQEEFYNMDIPTGIQRDFYNNGQLKSQSSWLNGKKHGMWSFFNESGILLKTEMYLDGELITTSQE